MPGRDKVENSECRGERRSLDGAVVGANLLESNVQQTDEDRGEDQYNGEGRSKSDHGSGHDRQAVGWTRLVMGIVMEGELECHRDQGVVEIVFEE